MTTIDADKDPLGGDYNDPVYDSYFDSGQIAESMKGATEYYEVNGMPIKFVYNEEGTNFTIHSFMEGRWVIDEVPTNFELDGVLVNRKKFNKMVKKVEGK